MACGNCSNGCSDCGGLECGEGAAGLNGFNAFTVTTGDFVQPDESDPAITIPVSALGQATGIWAVVGQRIFIEGAGYFQVTASTPTTISVIVPNAVTETFNHAIAASGATVTFPKEVSPGGIEGATGVPGSSTTGQDGTTQLVTLYGATAAVTTSFAPLHTAQTLPSSVSAPIWPTMGSILRVHLATVMTTVSGNGSTDHWKGEVEIVIDGVSVTLPISTAFLRTRTYFPYNGLTTTIDLVAISLAPLTIIADVRALEAGIGAYDGTNGYVVLPTSSNSPAHAGNPFASGYTTGIDQSADVSFQVNGRRVATGTPGGTPSLFMPMLKVERLIK